MGIELLAIATAIGAAGSIYYGHKQSKEMTKARREQQAQIAKQTAAAEAEKERLKKLEDERRKRLLAAGQKVPATLLTGGQGVTTPATVHRKTALGA